MLYDRDFTKLTPEEDAQYQAIKGKEAPKGQKLIIREATSIFSYPKAVRHHTRLFPNNYMDPADIKGQLSELSPLVDEFERLVHDIRTKERAIQRFIKDRKAYFIIGAIVKRGYTFGHHALYLFPEFELSAIYKPDFVLVGLSSEGYQFVFVELENPNGRITREDGDFGEVLQKGINQIEKWQNFIESEFGTLTKIFQRAMKIDDQNLPNEFYKYDVTRMHYTVVAGTRMDFSTEFAQKKRRTFGNKGIRVMHYDNLVDQARILLEEGNY
jgi:hypothetical protein